MAAPVISTRMFLQMQALYQEVRVFRIRMEEPNRDILAMALHALHTSAQILQPRLILRRQVRAVNRQQAIHLLIRQIKMDG